MEKENTTQDPLFKVTDIGIVDDNIILYPKGDKYQVIDGKRRLMALKKAGETTVSAIILKEGTTDTQAAMITLLKNNARTHNYIAELEALEVLQKNNVKPKIIAKYLNVSKATANSLLKLLTLPKELYTALKKNKITVAVAREIVKLDEATKSKAVKIFEKEGCLTGADIQGLRLKQKEAMSDAIPDKMFKTEETTIVSEPKGAGKNSARILADAVIKCQAIINKYHPDNTKESPETVFKKISDILNDKKIVALTK